MLPFRSGCPARHGLSALACVPFLLCAGPVAAQPEKALPPRAEKPKSTPAKGDIPLPIGHEAKGLVLPDYDLEGRLRARFEAATAKRIDEERIQFTGLKMTTFVPETAATDLSIEMPVSTLDMTSRVITSAERTTIRRADFSIEGDTMEFDTIGRKGKLMGNVKMVIKGDSALTGPIGQ
ncbi:hypothetical protein BH20VER1_BH20VER1_32070 [soil metagenome]